ncbi:MAG: zinc metallopeptidase [Nitrospinae bacterium]|nr:zinc metallopeptidase [Nitrospinota bacterium]
MFYLFLFLLLVAALVGPTLWAGHVMEKYAADNPALPGTGGDLARHLVERFGLSGVTVEEIDGGDHYDPETKTIRLSRRVARGRSLTAAAVAAHEVGPALQDAHGYAPLAARARLVKGAQRLEKAGAAALLLMPVALAITRSPMATFAVFALGGMSLSSVALVHLATLPVEWDASFGRALPILKEGGYLSEEEAPAARRVLTAAALTYVAASLAGILNVWRWMALVLRR